MEYASTRGPLALVGSGEYLERMAGVERELLVGRPPRYVQLATAAVPDGDHVVAKWHRLGREQAERLGVEQVVLPVASRADADSPAIAELIGDAGLIYLSGGHPAFLAATLHDTVVWRAIVRAWESGAALAGCSAGAMVLGSWVPHIRGAGGATGLGLVPHVRVIPHYDATFMRMTNVRQRFRGDDAATLLGIDENTAVIGGPHEWRVAGHARAWVLGDEGDQSYGAGESFRLD